LLEWADFVSDWTRTRKLEPPRSIGTAFTQNPEPLVGSDQQLASTKPSATVLFFMGMLQWRHW
jgi:hypothetical protein